MPFLLIETSTEQTLVALMQGEQVLFHKALPLGLNNSKYLAPSIAEGLQKLGITVLDLAYIAVGIGPGSYTGIRVGVMLAKSLAFAADIPLIGVSTLKCFAPTRAGSFVILVDARIGGVYAAGGFIDEARDVVYTLEPQVVPLEQIAPLVKQAQYIVTPQAKVLQPKLALLCPQSEWQQLPPNPLQMGRMAELQFLQGCWNLEGSLEIMYLRKTQAEIEKEKMRELL